MELHMGRKRLWALAVAVVFSAAGFALWVYEAFSSESVMGPTTETPWGSTIALFVVFIGLATGCMLIAAASVLFKWKDLEQVSGIAAAAGLAAAFGGAFYIMADLGSFSNILGMATGFNARSPLSWDMVAMTLFIVADIAFLMCLKRGHSVRGTALAAIIASLLLLCVDAWIFAFQTSREAWNSSLMLPWFVLSAVSSGLALTIVLSATSGVSFAGNGKVCAAIAALAAADALIALSEPVLGAYHASGTDANVASLLTISSLSPYFWFEIGASAIAVALALRARKSNSTALPVASSILVLLAVCAKRLYFIAAGFAVPHLPYAAAEGISTSVAEHGAGASWAADALMAAGGIGILFAVFLIVATMVPQGRDCTSSTGAHK